jgi:hypothetical protein
MVKANLPMRNAARGAKRKVPTPEPETAIPVAKALYIQPRVTANIVQLILKVHKIENFFDSDFGICVISLLVLSKYKDYTKKNF